MEAQVIDFGLLQARKRYDLFYEKTVERLELMHSNLLSKELEISALALGLNTSALHVLVKTYDSELCDTPQYGYTFQNHLAVVFKTEDDTPIDPKSKTFAYPTGFEWIDHRNGPFEYGISGFRSDWFLKVTITPLGTTQRPSVVDLSITEWIDSISDTAALGELYLGLSGIEQQLEHLRPYYEFVSNQTVKAFVKGVFDDYVITISTAPDVLINNISLLLELAPEGMDECN